MKVSLLIRFGGFTLFLAQFLLAIVDSAYYFAGRPAYPSTAITWVAILGLIIRVFGFSAVFAILARRGNLFGVGGFILLLFGEFFSVSRLVMVLGVVEGVLTGEQLGMAPSYAVILRYLPLFFILGQFLFGIAIVQSRVGLRVQGTLIAILGITLYLNSRLAFMPPIYSILAFIAWGWLGWEIFTGKDGTHVEPVRTD